MTRAIATAVGFSERAFRRLDDQLIEYLASRQVLLVLDNCEHVADAVAVIAERLLRETRNVTVLATSRERLGVDGEHLWPVRPLAADGPGAPAVRLFLDRARAADPASRPETIASGAIAAHVSRSVRSCSTAVPCPSALPPSATTSVNRRRLAGG